MSKNVKKSKKSKKVIGVDFGSDKTEPVIMKEITFDNGSKIISNEPFKYKLVEREWVEIYVEDTTLFPSQKFDTDAAWDLKSKTTIKLVRDKVSLILTGVFLAIPEGYYMEITPRSGLALNQGLTIVNSPGIIDSDYRNEVGIIVSLIGDKKEYIVQKGERIAQMSLKKIVSFGWDKKTKKEELSLPKSKRSGGFGSTGK